ncbi:hypothetical protein ACFL5C_03315 [Candidatus Omnitrophota bacterium]
MIEFQHEAFRMFTDLMVKIDEQTAERIMKISPEKRGSHLLC